MDMIAKMQARDRFARLCGIRTLRVGTGEAEVELTLRDDHLNALDMVQGGVLFTMADFAFALAANSHGIPAVGLSTSMNFLRPGCSGVLKAFARELSLTNKVGTYLVEITDESGTVLASFQGLAYRKPPEKPA